MYFQGTGACADDLSDLDPGSRWHGVVPCGGHDWRDLAASLRDLADMAAVISSVITGGRPSRRACV
jgi:hypothetical protein